MTASITQYSGTGSEAIIEQGPASGNIFNANSYIGNLSATIEQTGDSHFATQSQRRRNNAAAIEQSGFDNDARQGQDRDILDDEPGSNHDATITQGGASSFAEQQQNGNNHSALIVQSAGTNNRATQTQSSVADTFGGGNFASASQSGSDNVADQTQSGLDNDAWVTQAGSGNEATQLQNALAGGNDATITSMSSRNI